MSVKTYAEILKLAKTIQNNVKKEYKTGVWSWNSYYLAKAIITPKKDIKVISIKDAPNPNGTAISNQIKKADYLDMCKRYVKWIEKNKVMPNYATTGKYRITPHLMTEILSRILVTYDKNGKLPSSINANSKVFTKPSETGNVVYDYFAKKTGKKPKTIDEVLGYMQGKGYGNYSDDKLSNKQVIDGLVNKSDALDANCTDALQMLINMGKAMGYDCKCIHVQCRTSGTGHVFGKFRHKKHTENTWIVRDPASVLDGNGIRSVWCENGYLLATDPSWFLANLNR